MPSGGEFISLADMPLGAGDRSGAAAAGGGAKSSSIRSAEAAGSGDSIGFGAARGAARGVDDAGAAAGGAVGASIPSGMACQTFSQLRHLTLRPVGPIASSLTRNLVLQLGHVRIIRTAPLSKDIKDDQFVFADFGDSRNFTSGFGGVNFKPDLGMARLCQDLRRMPLCAGS